MLLELGEWLAATRLSEAIQSAGWAIPLLQSIHILMIGIVFVSILIVSLRVLGRARPDEPIDRVWSRFAPWLWSALVVMAITGALLVVGEPLRQFTSLSFWLKMALLAIGVVGALLFARSVHAAVAHPGAELSPLHKAAAAATVVLWLGIIFLGRAIAYDVEVWGSLSLAARG